MSKIICDVCGSAYSDTASQCPICGTAKRDTSPVAQDPQNAAAAEAGYNYVKGGRFSHNNVRKHNSGQALHRKAPENSAAVDSSMPPLIPEKDKKAPKQEKPVKPTAEDKSAAPKPEKDYAAAEQRTNIILIAVVLILLLAVIFVGVYIVRNYKDLFPSVDGPEETQSSSQSTVGGVRIPCVGITLPALEHVESDGSPIALQFEFTPATTTDEKTYISSDPAIATVDADGTLRVYASGEVTVTVACGDQTANLVLSCVFVPPTTATDPTQPSVPEAELELVKYDVSFSEYGVEWQMYTGQIDASLITFTSSDESIVTVDATGKIKVVGKGTATVTAQYGDQKKECIVRCNKVTVPVVSNYKLNYTDITIKIGERQLIQLFDKETGAPVKGLNWYTSMDAYISIEIIETGVRVTGTGASGRDWVRVMCDYEGVTYTCIIRVREAPAE